MKKISLILLFVMLESLTIAQEATFKQIEALLHKELSKENIHNVFLSVYSPTRGIEWHAAKGTFHDGTEVTTDNPFYTASVGKTFTATAIGMLVDRGLIGFNDRIASYLPADVMAGLHVYEGVDYGDSITVAHLLRHTSGLPDYFSPNTVDGTPGMFDLIMTAPNRFWQPEELIAFSKAHFKPGFAPGTGYFYTDTEFVLLGMIVENVSGLALHEFFELNMFIPLKMVHTYLNQRSEPEQPTLPMAEMYAGSHELSSLKSLSADWAGGAVVATGKDLIVFLNALMNGKLVSAATLGQMQQWIAETQGMAYGFGSRKIDFTELDSGLPNFVAIGHAGGNGTIMYYCPDLDIYLTGTLNQLEATKSAVILMATVLVLCQGL